MATSPRRRTIPCSRCRDKHIKCDGNDPCSTCTLSDVACRRASKRFRFKRLVPSHEFASHADQPWAPRSESSSSQTPLHFIDEAESITSSHSAYAQSESYQTDDSSANQTFTSRGSQESPLGSSLLNIPSSGMTPAESSLQSPPFPTSIHGRSAIGKPLNSDPSTAPSLMHETSLGLDQTTHTLTQTPRPYTALSPSNSLTVQGSCTIPSLDEDQPPPNYFHPAFQALPNVNDSSLVEYTEDGGYLSLQEACLLQYYTEHLSGGFETIDPDRHYSTVVPLRALKCRLLLHSICTVAARYLAYAWMSTTSQMPIEFNGIPLPDLNEETALHYHNMCISHLVSLSPDHADLGKDDDVFVAITVLRNYEQVDEHFTGEDSEAYLNAIVAAFRAQYDHGSGSSAGSPFVADSLSPVMSSLRWSACLISLRHEIWSVLLYRRPFTLPLDIFDEFLQSPQRIQKCDDRYWTTRIILWCAHILRLHFGYQDDSCIRSGKVEYNDPHAHAAIELFERDWGDWAGQNPHEQQDHFRPIYAEPRDPERGQYFPRIWLANECKTVGFQHVELVRILYAVRQSKSKMLGVGALTAYQSLASVLRRATRRLCGAAICNTKAPDQMVTASLGISLCGAYFHDPNEQAALVDLLVLLEKEHSRPTKTMIKALQAEWNSLLPQ